MLFSYNGIPAGTTGPGHGPFTAVRDKGRIDFHTVSVVCLQGLSQSHRDN